MTEYRKITTVRAKRMWTKSDMEEAKATASNPELAKRGNYLVTGHRGCTYIIIKDVFEEMYVRTNSGVGIYLPDPFEHSWWDENGEAAWFDVEHFSEWEAMAAFAYYLYQGDILCGTKIELVKMVVLRKPDPDDPDGRMHICSEDDVHPDDQIHAWEVIC